MGKVNIRQEEHTGGIAMRKESFKKAQSGGLPLSCAFVLSE